ncbi:ATP-binding protein [Thermodesulfovibrio thiophilus]|uniref:ATP-binding protein n=1 Tax=Thermodesulfovibrio thiophilus TaxID=340095 RepID=UPI000428AD9D|nr:ATP-binding protein [Thermodesulfovibrio thiophilus]
MNELRIDNIINWLPEFIKNKNSSISGKINLSSTKWIEPVGISIIKSIELSTPDIEIIKPASKNVKNYLDIMQSDCSSQGQTFMSIKIINTRQQSNIDKIANEIAEKMLKNIDFKDDMEYKKDYQDYLKYMLSEVMLNAVSHSDSTVDIVACAQYYPYKRKTQVSIVDCGVGFKATLSRKHNDIFNERDALKKAIQKGITGSIQYVYQNAIKNIGIGLYALSQMVKKLNGYLSIVSKDGCLILENNQIRTTELPCKWDGSIVAFEFDLNVINLDFIDFMKLYVYQEENSEEDIF